MPSVHVKNGTNAGWRRTKPRPVAYQCVGCYTSQPGYATRCLSCGTPRPI